MFRALVVEDDPPFAMLLSDVLRGTGKVEVVGRASNGVDAIELWQAHKPDVVFLDVMMPEMDGLEVASALIKEENAPLIIFITGHGEYAIRAFELQALDYIPKQVNIPLLEERIKKAVERAESALLARPQQIRALRDRLEKVSEALEMLALRPGHRLQRIPVKDYQEGTVRLIDPESVTSAERVGRRTVLRTNEHEYPTYYTIDRLEKRLGANGFVRANPGALVNLRFVDHLVPNGDGSYDLYLKDRNSTVITVSRSRSRQLLTSLEP